MEGFAIAQRYRMFFYLERLSNQKYEEYKFLIIAVSFY